MIYVFYFIFLLLRIWIVEHINPGHSNQSIISICLLSEWEELSQGANSFVDDDTFIVFSLLRTGASATDQIKREISKQTSECATCCSRKAGTVSLCECSLKQSMTFCSLHWWLVLKEIPMKHNFPTFLSFFSASGDVWHYPRWEPAGRCLWTPCRVLGSILASYTHVTQHTAQPTAGTQSGLHGALTLSCRHSGEITINYYE